MFLACKNRLQTPMITRQSCKTSDVVMGIPSFHRREQEGPPEWRSHRLPLRAALKDDSFLIPVYHSFQHFAILFAFLTSQGNPFLQRKMDLCRIFVGASIARPLLSGRWRASLERASNARPLQEAAFFAKLSSLAYVLLAIDKIPPAGYTNRKGAAGSRLAPQLVTRSNRFC